MKPLKRLNTIKEVEEERLKAEYEALLHKRSLLLRWIVIKTELAPERLITLSFSYLVRLVRNISSQRKEGAE